MKKGFLALLVFLPAALLWSIPQDKLVQAKIKNSTGKTLQYLYISAKDSDAWCADLLGEKSPLASGKNRQFSLYNNNEKDTYDILAVDKDGTKYQKEFEASQGSKIDVELLKADENGPFESLFQTVTVTNGTEKAWDFLFFSQDQSSVWGPDLLGKDQQVKPGEKVSFLLPLYNQEGGILFNFLAVDDQGNEYQMNETAAGSEEPLDVTIDPSHLQQPESGPGDEEER